MTETGGEAKSVRLANSYTEQELASLMVSYQGGDRSAGEALVRALSPQLYGFLSLRQLNSSMNEDILQDCWLEIHRSRHTYQPGRPVLPWVYAIARHVRARAAQRYRRRLDNETPLKPEDLAAVGPAAQPDDVYELLNRLPDGQREALYLLKFVGLTLQETAAATRSTVGAVKQRAYRAYQAVRALRLRTEKRSGRSDEEPQ